MRYGLRDFCARDIDGFSLNAAFSVASSGSGSGGGFSGGGGGGAF